MALNLINLPSRFKGDGRRKLSPLPQDIWPSTRPMRVSRAAAVRLCRAFESNGVTTHSVAGAMLWVVLEHCRETGQTCEVHGSAGIGFTATKKQQTNGG